MPTPETRHMLDDTLLHGGALHGQTHVAQGHLAADSLTGSRDIPQCTVHGKVLAPRQPVAPWELQKTFRSKNTPWTTPQEATSCNSAD